MSLIQNERTKLTATYLNGVAIAILAVGGFAPAIGWVNSGNGRGDHIGMVSAVCILVSGAIHLSARYLLKGLKP